MNEGRPTQLAEKPRGGGVKRQFSAFLVAITSETLEIGLAFWRYAIPCRPVRTDCKMNGLELS